MATSDERERRLACISATTEWTMDPTLELPSQVQEAFTNKPYLAMPALAKVTKIDLKTLRKHREVGNLPVHIKGTGSERRHYVCTLKDVIEFYRRTSISSLSTAVTMTKQNSPTKVRPRLRRRLRKI